MKFNTSLRPGLTILAAVVLAVESLVFVGVHVKYREITPVIFSAVLGLLMAFIAYGRMVLSQFSDRHRRLIFMSDNLPYLDLRRVKYAPVFYVAEA